MEQAPATKSGVGLPPRARRILGGLLMVVAFMGIASVISPDRSSASSVNDRRLFDPPAVNTHGYRLMGELVGVDFKVWIYASGDGPRYTIVGADGFMLAENLLAEEVYRNFGGPDGEGIDVTDMILEPIPGESGIGPVMMAGL